MKNRLTLLILSSLLVWVIVAYPARLWWGNSAAVYSGVAVVLCLVPTTLTLLWSHWALKKSPEQQLLLVLGGTGLRMAVVLSVGLVLYFGIPYFRQQSFWIWILVFYLLTLAIEMALMLSGKPNTSS